MFNIIKKFFTSQESNELWVSILSFSLVFYYFKAALMPILASILIAFLLTGFYNWVDKTIKHKYISAGIVVATVLSFFIGIIVAVFPLAINQLKVFLQELPRVAKILLSEIQEYLDYYKLNVDILNTVNELIGSNIDIGRFIINISVSTFSDLMVVLIYIVSIPLIIYFFLISSADISAGFEEMLQNRKRILAIFQEINEGIRGYITGKALEAFIIFLVTFACFYLLGINYVLFLSISVGLSVILPYLGAILVTLPVTVVAYSQFGLENHFFIILAVYIIIQFFDSNILFPLLFSGIMQVDPLTILVGVLFFSSILGAYGSFLSIPFIVIIKSLISKWPIEPKENNVK